MRHLLLNLLCAAVLTAGPGLAQPVAARDDPLPADATSDQVLELPGRALHFTATAGFVRLQDGRGAPEADIATTAYLLDGADPAVRPVTFVLNGGPGMASAWLQMGAVGPWRVPMLPQPSAPAGPQPNPDTWLDMTDLVFIDPVGTGYSHFDNTGDDLRKRLWSVGGDIDALGQAIRRWLDKSGRIASPKYLLGESYGGFRGPLLAQRLAASDGVGLRGMLLLSPILDYGNRSAALDVLTSAAALPSMAATVRAESDHPVTRADLADAEAYAAGPFLTDVLRGPADPAALDRVVTGVSALTGLDPAIVRQRRGLIGSGVFLHERGRIAGRVGSIYDATVNAADPFPEDPSGRVPDPMLAGLRAPITAGMLAVYDRLHWHPGTGLYQLVSDEAFRQWNYGNDFYRPQALTALRRDLALDGSLHVIVAHGLFDLVCPYFGSAVLLDQIPPASGGDRVDLMTVPGGHMFYSRDDGRAALHAMGERLYGTVTDTPQLVRPDRRQSPTVAR